VVKVSKEVLKIKNNWQRLREYWKIKKIDLNQDLAKMVDNRISLKKLRAIKISKKVDHNHKKKEVEVGIKEAPVNGLKRLIKRPNKLISNLLVADSQI